MFNFAYLTRAQTVPGMPTTGKRPSTRFPHPQSSGFGSVLSHGITPQELA